TTRLLSGMLVVAAWTGQHPARVPGRTLVAPTSSAGRSLPWPSNIIRLVKTPSGVVTNRILAPFGTSGPRMRDVCAAGPRKPAKAPDAGATPETITVPGFARASADRAVAM